MKKRILSVALSALLCLSVLAGCTSSSPSAPTSNPGANTQTPNNPATTTPTETPAAPVTIRVKGMFGGDDTGRVPFDNAIAKYEAETGNTVQNESSTVDDAWRASVLADFETGSDPDIIQYFTGTDSNSLIQGNKIVSVEEIRSVYPDYANNINQGAIDNVASPVDGKSYGVPTNGYWEGTFYNKKLLADAGYSEFPATWDEFLKLCDALVANGVTPIAESFSEPNYTFEFLLYNKAGQDIVTTTPKAKGDAAYNMYVEVLNVFKMFTDKGYYPANIMSITRAEAVQLFADGKAAMCFGGHWNRGGMDVDANGVKQAATDDIDLFGFPTENASIRDAMSFVGGYSSGFMITRKAWDDPAKRQACVDFIKYALSDEAVTAYSGASASPLKTPGKVADSTALLERCQAAIAKGVAIVPAVEDTWTVPAKEGFYYSDLAKFCSGAITAEQAVDNFIALNAN
ncbi:MAG: extracellular solute-binding protein [Oscillospiraceae bacterium]|jgi:raffinose/stachyose/melibiose transport system substrate-binding protein|nr:extracellular solute-binding protein [Oscillospiraceae bacterium]